MKKPQPEQIIETVVCATTALLVGLAVYWYPESRGVGSLLGGAAVFLGLMVVSGLGE